MSEQNEQDWGNYWQGRTSSEALVGVEHSDKLIAFWSSCFAPLKPSTKLLDMACGAGSVLRHAQERGIKNLTGADIASDAINAMKAAIPSAKGIVCPVDSTGLPDQSFDVVVSQFGFEYAGNDEKVIASAAEMARLIVPKGQFTALCHIVGGSIEQEVNGHLSGIMAIEHTGFIQAAKTVFNAAYAAQDAPSPSSKADYDAAVQGLTPPRDALVSWIGEHQDSNDQIAGLAAHLYNGTLKMFNRRKAYALDDVIGWLDGMAHEIDAYKGRMASMKRAALTKPQAQAIMAVFETAGFATQPLTTLSLENTGAPAAWILSATR